MMDRNILAKVQNLVREAVIDVPGEAPQVRYFSGRVDAATPVREPQGLHFMGAAEARGLLLSPAADAGSAVLVCAQGDVPSDSIEPGEGGLHCLGEWRVFIDAQGNVHLGSRDAGDYVALASRVDAEIARIDQAITKLALAVKPVAAVTDALTPGTGTAYNGATAALPGASSSVASSKVKVL